jgi:hypothetical protein
MREGGEGPRGGTSWRWAWIGTMLLARTPTVSSQNFDICFTVACKSASCRFTTAGGGQSTPKGEKEEG